VASGVEAAIKTLRRKKRHFLDDKKINVCAIAGDGGTMDIGLQALSGAMERGHDMLYICYDNEAYMNTGIQRSSATPWGASTTTSPAGRVSRGQTSWKKDLTEILVAHRIPYVAKASVSHPFDLIEKVKKAAAVDGPAFLHVFAPCPTGWRCAPDLAIRLADQAVQAGVFPLYEVENGVYKLSFDPDPLLPLAEYIQPQGRFRHLTPQEIEKIQERVRAEFAAIKRKCEWSQAEAAR
jgi:pyruvate ferredoxin oxidoreductase beta subunit